MKTYEQKLKDALSYLGNKYLLAKDSKFVYTRGHSVLNNHFKGVK